MVACQIGWLAWVGMSYHQHLRIFETFLLDLLLFLPKISNVILQIVILYRTSKEFWLPSACQSPYLPVGKKGRNVHALVGHALVGLNIRMVRLCWDVGTTHTWHTRHDYKHTSESSINILTHLDKAEPPQLRPNKFNPSSVIKNVILVNFQPYFFF